MITITVYKNEIGFTGFTSQGHAGYADHGYDIICAGVSVLTVNTLNSIETYTNDKFKVKQKDGFIQCKFNGVLSEQSNLLMNSMILGLKSIQQDYGNEYIQVIFKEV